MAGKPHETGFSEEIHTVEDLFGLDSKREILHPTVSSTANLSEVLAGDS
ncbi:hypothetical protein BSY238_3216 [Methyloversatilis sp. RAC08]|nr:hypothetical protein BSY238_3216 [Methyloversatilis sp. RAC08]